MGACSLALAAIVKKRSDISICFEFDFEPNLTILFDVNDLTRLSQMRLWPELSTPG